MRIIDGAFVRQIDMADVTAWTARYGGTTIDLGAGDGRFARHLARQHPDHGVIAVDLCEANLRAASRTAGGNALLVVADALALPAELNGVATRVTLNFPWGSLLRGLLDGHSRLFAGLDAIGRHRATVEIALNAGAIAEAGWSLEAGRARVMKSLRDAGMEIVSTQDLGPADLRRWPTTWAKRLAFGRDPRAVRIDATLV